MRSRRIAVFTAAALLPPSAAFACSGGADAAGFFGVFALMLLPVLILTVAVMAAKAACYFLALKRVGFGAMAAGHAIAAPVAALFAALQAIYSRGPLGGFIFPVLAMVAVFCICLYFERRDMMKPDAEGKPAPIERLTIITAFNGLSAAGFWSIMQFLSSSVQC